jgi:hypothetical protein
MAKAPKPTKSNNAGFAILVALIVVALILSALGYCDPAGGAQ